MKVLLFKDYKECFVIAEKNEHRYLDTINFSTELTLTILMMFYLYFISMFE